MAGWNAPPRLQKHLSALIFFQCASAFIHLPFHPISTPSSLRIAPQARPGPRILRAAAAGARSEAWKPLPIEVEKPPASTAIIGGGPAGLTTAIMLAQRGWSGITVYDKRAAPPPADSDVWGDAERSYNLGLSARGQGALKDLGVSEQIISRATAVTGKRSWSPGNLESKNGTLSLSVAKSGYKTLVMQRDRLQASLLDVLSSRYSHSVDVVFNTECASVALNGEGVTIGMRATQFTPKNLTDPLERMRSSTTIVGNVEKRQVDLVVGADGGRSAVCDFMETESSGKIQVKRFEDENKRVYKTITLDPPDSEPRNLSYGVRTEQELIIESLPTHQDKQIAVLLFRPDDQRVLSIKTEAQAKAFFTEFFPMLVAYIREESYSFFASQAVSLLPVFKHCGATLHLSNSTVLVGDSIHAVKPYFGLGANSALEDTIVLRRALDASPGDRATAFRAYSKERGPDAVAIVEMSQKMDRPGTAGFLSFILPLIVDSTFKKYLPGLFTGTTTSSLQNPGRRPSELVMRKRFERVAQLLIISTLVAASLYASAAVLKLLIISPLVAASLYASAAALKVLSAAFGGPVTAFLSSSTDATIAFLVGAAKFLRYGAVAA
ncbi:hypothetical protein T484DRAFT_1893076 [Baffinella frigidus]|nr:hypothetical protein T484DRAFT_1893076 [Cryptophyta sp. CCMP2293]